MAGTSRPRAPSPLDEHTVELLRIAICDTLRCQFRKLSDDLRTEFVLTLRAPDARSAVTDLSSQALLISDNNSEYSTAEVYDGNIPHQVLSCGSLVRFAPSSAWDTGNGCGEDRRPIALASVLPSAPDQSRQAEGDHHQAIPAVADHSLRVCRSQSLTSKASVPSDGVRAVQGGGGNARRKSAASRRRSRACGPSVFSEGVDFDHTVTKTSSASMRPFDILPRAKVGTRAFTVQQLADGQTRVLSVAAIVFNPWFDRVVLLAVTINAVLAGVAADQLARDAEWNHSSLRPLEMTLFLVFVVEMCMRLFVYRSAFFRGSSRRWNLFDLFVVLLQFVEEGVMVFTEHRNLLVGRCLRALRALKVLRIAKYNDDVKILIGCCVQSVHSFWGAGLCLLLFVYMMSILILSFTSMQAGDGSGTGEEQLEYWYGSLPLTMLTLLQSLTGGVDWGDATRPLTDHVSLPLGIASAFWTLCSIIVLMNVITGIFVSTAMNHASRAAIDKDIIRAEDLFMQLDVDRNSHLGFDEFVEFVNTPQAAHFFSAQKVKKSDAQLLFKLLDRDGSGDISIREFISGCVQLKEQVRLVDVLYLSQHVDRLFGEMEESLRAASNDVVAHWSSDTSA